MILQEEEQAQAETRWLHLYIRKEFRKAKLDPFTGDGLQRFKVNVSAEMR